MTKTGFEALLRTKAASAHEVYVLEERGTDISQAKIGENLVFILGDHVGLPKRAEDFTLRYGSKLSLGKQPYLAATCITILNYTLDTRAIG